MKINYLFILLLITTQAFAQKNKYSFGIEGGTSLTTLRGNNTQNFTYTPGYSIGLAFQHNVTEVFSIHSGISYERKGTELSISNADSQSPFILKFDFDYITMPILIRLSFGSKAKFFINAGPYLGYLMNYEWLDNRLDIGLVTGLGGQIDLNKNLVLSLELRNNLGLTPITSDIIQFNNNSYNNSINGLIGIAYQFGNTTVD